MYYCRDHPCLVSMLFADLLSLHLFTFLMFFTLVKEGAASGSSVRYCH